MKRLIRKIKKRLLFKRIFKSFKLEASEHTKRFNLRESDIYRCMDDNTETTGFDRHYIYHTAWAARYLKKQETTHHIDISSTLFFCGIVSAFLDVDFYDYRPADLELSGLDSKKGDLTQLPWKNDSVKSLSCMHTVEHIGLGRYGDPLDYNGDLKAIKELARVLAVGGDLLFVVPVGKEARIQFNAHRIYTKQQVVESFEKEGLYLKEFVLIPEKGEDGGLIANPNDSLLNKQKYACGCFAFSKKN